MAAPQQQPLPPLTKEEVFPHGYSLEIGKNNARVELDKIKCSDPSCQIAVELLKAHKCRNLLDSSDTIPELYIHQFWDTFTLSSDDEYFTIQLDRKRIRVTPYHLRKALDLPDAPETSNQFYPTPSESEIMQFLVDIGYDVQPDTPLTKISKVNAKYIPQPWRTIFYIITRSISGRDSGYEHPRLSHLQVFWGFVNQEKIDFAALIWEDILFQMRKAFKQIPFVRYTKVLISYLLDLHKDIDRRPTDREVHPYMLDKTFRKVYFPKGSTHKQGTRLPV